MGVLHGGSNIEEITRFAVKRVNVPLLATVTVMPHTTRFQLYLLGLAMRLFLLMRIDAHQMRINAHKPHQ